MYSRKGASVLKSKNIEIFNTDNTNNVKGQAFKTNNYPNSTLFCQHDKTEMIG